MSPYRAILLFCLAIAAAASTARADDSKIFRIGADVFAAGSEVAAGGTGTGNLFLAGETAEITGPITGNAHLAGRRLTAGAEVGGDLYALGLRVKVAAPVAGDVTAAAALVSVDAAVGGNLRATGRRVSVSAPVSGYALIAGERLTLDGAIAGDAVLAGEHISFGPNARVGGKLTLFAEDPQAVTVPESVAPAARIERRAAEDFHAEAAARALPVSRFSLVLGFLGGVVFLAAMATIVAALAPEGMARLRHEVLVRPGRAIWFGFLGLSVPIGGAVLLALTLVGLIASPALILGAVILGFTGYVVGVYALGVALLGALGRPEPAILRERALAALTGALVTALVLLIPLFGWLFGFGLTLLGVGAVIERMLRPRFRTEAAV